MNGTLACAHLEKTHEYMNVLEYYLNSLVLNPQKQALFAWTQFNIMYNFYCFSRGSLLHLSASFGVLILRYRGPFFIFSHLQLSWLLMILPVAREQS